PLFSIIISHLRLIDLIQLIRTLFGILSHSSAIYCSNSERFLGMCISTFLLTIAQRFSIGFKSGLLESQSITSGKFSLKNARAIRLVCFGSLSCWKRQL